MRTCQANLPVAQLPPHIDQAARLLERQRLDLFPLHQKYLDRFCGLSRKPFHKQPVQRSLSRLGNKCEGSLPIFISR